MFWNDTTWDVVAYVAGVENNGDIKALPPRGDEGCLQFLHKKKTNFNALAQIF